MLLVTTHTALMGAGRKSRLRVPHRILVLSFASSPMRDDGAGPVEYVGPGPGAAGGDAGGDSRFHEALVFCGPVPARKTAIRPVF